MSSVLSKLTQTLDRAATKLPDRVLRSEEHVNAPTGHIDAPTEPMSKEKYIEEDGTVVYIYRKGNKCIKRKYKPNTECHIRREKTISIIKELLEQYPNEKVCQLYKKYLERVENDEALAELRERKYKQNAFYSIYRFAKLSSITTS